MWRRAVCVVAVAVLASCTYDPAFQISCESEGAELDGRRCEKGVWVETPDAGEGDDETPLPDVSPSNDTTLDLGQSDVADDDTGGCLPESSAAFCARLGFTCDDVTAEDNCGDVRTENCGTCDPPATCGGGGTDNVCACSDESDVDFCARYGKSCDVFSAEDVCGMERTVNCGTCSGLESCVANACVCDAPAACAALQYDCGTVDVSGTCGGQQEIDCGTCGDHASCGDANVCVCEEGYAGTPCQDVDECSTGTHDCDPNADCTNEVGGFECTCKDGYMGDGRTCVPEPTSPALSVQTVSVSLSSDSTATVSLPTPLVDPTQAVPFASSRLANTGGEIDRLSADVSIDASGELVVRRDDPTGSAHYVVNVVEFDPAIAAVQSGSFSFNQTTHSVTLPNAVNRAAAFLVFYAVNDDSTDRKDALMVGARLSQAGDEIIFGRDDGRGTISGHWYVVESLDGSFEVAHLSGGITEAERQVELDLPANANAAKSFLLYSHAASRGDNNSDASTLGCGLESDQVVCRRYSDSNSIPGIAVQVVTFTTTPVVYRGTSNFSSNDDANVESIGATVGAASMAFGGRIGVPGVTRLNTTSGMASEAAYFTLAIVNNGTSVDIVREEDAAEAIVDWQIVDW